MPAMHDGMFKGDVDIPQDTNVLVVAKQDHVVLHSDLLE